MRKVPTIQPSLGLPDVSIIDQLTAIAASKADAGYLRAYADDLHVHDRDTLAASVTGQRYVWALRECGTQLFPVSSGMESEWLTYWLDQGNTRAVQTLCFLVIVTETGGQRGEVTPISYERARQLAALPHPEGKVIKFSLCGHGETGA